MTMARVTRGFLQRQDLSLRIGISRARRPTCSVTPAALSARLRPTGRLYHASTDRRISITFIEGDGTEVSVDADAGDSLLDTAHKHDVDIEGACGGELACSTCHVVFSQEEYDTIEGLSAKTEEEEDMLDLAWGLTDTSRLGCQIRVCEELEGLRVNIPEDADNML
eukprot:FR738440.1.p2 GENE.FR738440.1~~FR738440.1.p2  ORF type:complete len:166 (+),score=4.24 FR738440.1:142-639(+)